MARLKYGGGSDWYNDPSAEINLLRFIEKNTGLKVRAEYNFVDISTEDIFSYPFLFMTGHGNVVLSDSEAKRLRRYLENGGFLYVDDDYGLDKAFRREIAKVFPDNGLQEVPFNHPVYNIFYNFSQGPPKTHKHDENPPGGYGIFYNGRMVLYYTVESNPSDGWADPEVHDNPPEKREEALKFGTNIVLYAISN
ncbi:MAG: DUF4159 domain-containing protein [Ignavibacteriaceae bacterium]|nr:DUF4159 domain-containing protein [Ignavibacteriaceae bacterium]